LMLFILRRERSPDDPALEPLVHRRPPTARCVSGRDRLARLDIFAPAFGCDMRRSVPRIAP
jgi:hypothetical protein